MPALRESPLEELFHYTTLGAITGWKSRFRRGSGAFDPSRDPHTIRALRRQHLMQMHVKRPEVAAVVAGRDAQHAFHASGAHAKPGCFFDGLQIDAVDHDLVNGVGLGRERRFDESL